MNPVYIERELFTTRGARIKIREYLTRLYACCIYNFSFPVARFNSTYNGKHPVSFVDLFLLSQDDLIVYYLSNEIQHAPSKINRHSSSHASWQ